LLYDSLTVDVPAGFLPSNDAFVINNITYYEVVNATEAIDGIRQAVQKLPLLGVLLATNFTQFRHSTAAFYFSVSCALFISCTDWLDQSTGILTTALAHQFNESHFSFGKQLWLLTWLWYLSAAMVWGAIIAKLL
jgi:hypothetical protein